MNIHVKSFLKVVVLFLVLFTAYGMKQSQARANDWHLKNIGALTHLYPIKNNRVFFMSELGVFGHLSKDSGDIENRQTLNSGEKVLSVNPREVVISTPLGQVLVYKVETLDKYVENRLIDSILAVGPIIGYVKRDDGLVYIAGEKQVRLYTDGSSTHQTLATTKENQKFLKLFQVDSQERKLVVVKASEGKLCHQEILGKTVLTNSTMSFCRQTSIIG